jgi:hypothetical protein
MSLLLCFTTKPKHVASIVNKKDCLLINLFWGGWKVLLIQFRKQKMYATYQDKIYLNIFW